MARRPIRVLVFGGDADLADILREILERAGYQVDTAADSRVALEKISADVYDAIVCDLEISCLAGLESEPEPARRGAGAPGG